MVFQNTWIEEMLGAQHGSTVQLLSHGLLYDSCTQSRILCRLPSGFHGHGFHGNHGQSVELPEDQDKTLLEEGFVYFYFYHDHMRIREQWQWG